MIKNAVILAGGKSSRMGCDKAFLMWKGKTFVERIISAAQQIAQKVVLSGDASRLRKLGLDVIEDEVTGNGPVYALASSFKKMGQTPTLVISCDVPQVTVQDLEYLVAQHNSQFDVTCFEYNGKTLPLIGIYSANSFKAFYRAVENGERKLFSVLNNLKVKRIKYNGVSGLQNVNTPQDLKELI